jgi:beta-xylosidase
VTSPGSSDLVNDSDRPVAEVVQVYLHDHTASVVRPVQQLVGAARVDLPVGGSGRTGRSSPQ